MWSVARRVEASIMKGLGVRAGVPYIIAIKDGRAFGLELKALGGRLSAVQREAHAALTAAGATVSTAGSLDDALGLLELWGLLRGVSDNGYTTAGSCVARAPATRRPVKAA